MHARWNALPAVSGLAFVILTLVAGVLVGRPPDPADADAILTFVTDGRDRLVWAGAFGGAAAFLFLWFLGAHQDHLRTLTPDRRLLARVALAAAAVTLGLVLLAVAVIAGLAVAVAGAIDPAITRSLYVIALVALAGATYPTTAAFVSASSVAVLLAADRDRAPRWLGWSGLALAGAQLTAGFTITSDHDVYGLGGLFAGAVFLTFLTWVATTSLTMHRSS